jgi:hypothetical protein
MTLSQEWQSQLQCDGYQPPPITQIQTRLIDTSGVLAEEPSSKEISYLHAVLCQVGLPRKLTKAERFERISGHTSLLVEAGSLWSGKEWVKEPLPYGCKPRLALIHICTYAVQNQTPCIDIGHSAREFLTNLRLGTGGREYDRFRRQIRALAACHMTLGHNATTVDAKPIKRFSAWLGNSQQRAFWPGEIELAPDFYNSLVNHAVPIDPRAIGALQHSSLAMDVYVWLAHRLHRIKSPNGICIPWRALRAQFGDEYKDHRDFKKAFSGALQSATTVYPDARFDWRHGSGLILQPSPPPIRKTVMTVQKLGGK